MVEKKEFVINAETKKCYTAIPENVEGKFALITSMQSVLDQFPDKKDLILILDGIRGKAAKANEGKSAKKLVYSCRFVNFIPTPLS